MVINMKKLFVWAIRIFVFAILAVTAINLYTVYSVKNRIGAELKNADCILIFRYAEGQAYHGYKCL